VKRTCVGTDDNLTHVIPADAYDPATHTLSWWDEVSPPGHRTIRCHCGLTFDDVNRRVLYPHPLVNPHLS
jgi:hypothetical protein